MPVRRKDVVKAKYICFILNGVLGIAAALLTVIISQLLQIDINVEKSFFKHYIWNSNYFCSSCIDVSITSDLWS